MLSQIAIFENKNFKIKCTLLPGAYVPITKEGNILVDGVLTSCYADFDHDLAHLTMTPMQWFPEIIDGILGDGTGFPAYVRIARELGIRCKVWFDVALWSIF